MLILIIHYSNNTNRNNFMDIVILIYFLCNYFKINVLFTFLDIICFYLSSRIKIYLIDIKKKYFEKNSKVNSNEENEFKSRLMLIVFLAALVLLIIQIYIFKNLEKIIKLLENISVKMEFDDEAYSYHETTFVSYIINQFNYLFKINLQK